MYFENINNKILNKCEVQEKKNKKFIWENFCEHLEYGKKD